MNIVGFRPEESRGALASKNERLASELEVSEIQNKALRADLDRANRTILVLETEITQAGIRNLAPTPPPAGWVPIARKPDAAAAWSLMPDTDWTIKSARVAYDMGQVELATRPVGRSGVCELLLYRRQRRTERLPYFAPKPANA